ncbi:MAG: ABC transporter ATP-binding protein [Deltaproteobacteria bacterium]|nr:ABC transporter ATP-binding protein [Deltaproteobacteria bacterium]
MGAPIIEVNGISKKYRIGQREDYLSLRDSLTKIIKKPLNLLKGLSNTGASNDEFWALKDVSFNVEQGEVIGIIGKNGAGKTTMLKILSRITYPTKGEIHVRGRVASLLEVGTGFHPELTGRENIYFNGSILGMKKREINKKFDEIVAFSEIEKFIDTPVKRYSSGMYVRLAFAVAAHLDPEILLVDEVLAVGDFQFQKKCLNKMKDTSASGRTIFFVSHNMGAIRQLCQKCIWLEHGGIREIGAPSTLIDSYVRSADKSEGTGCVSFDENIKKDSQLLAVRLLNQDGLVAQNFICDEPIMIEFIYKVHRQVPGLYAYLSVSRTDGTCVFVSDSFDSPPNPLDNLPVGKHAVRITIPPRILGSGDYTVYLNFTSHFSFKSFNVDSPGIVGIFHLDDFKSHRGNNREGFISTLLSWDVNRLE